MSNTQLLTPYAAAKLVNNALAEAGVSKKIPPQMMYNYTFARLDDGKTPLIKASREEGVDREDLDRWIKSYVAKKVQEATPADPEQAEFDASEAS
jgi:hypothetical protein